MWQGVPCLGKQAYFTFLSDHEPSWTGGTILRQREYHKEAEQWDKLPSSRSRNSRPGAVHPVSLSGCLRICALFSRIEVSSVFRVILQPTELLKWWTLTIHVIILAGTSPRECAGKIRPFRSACGHNNPNSAPISCVACLVSIIRNMKR